jgi:hypothetical protein
MSSVGVVGYSEVPNRFTPKVLRRIVGITEVSCCRMLPDSISIGRITKAPPELAEVELLSFSVTPAGCDGSTSREPAAASHHCQQSLHKAVGLSDDMAAIAGALGRIACAIERIESRPQITR